jgi:hypothetical protein
MEDPHQVVAYAAFLVARGVVAGTLSKHLSTLRKVLAWRASHTTDPTAHNKLQAVIAWVDVLLKQCMHVATPSNSNLQQTKLPHARDVLQWQLKVYQYADGQLANDITKWGKMFRHETVKACQDAALLGMCFGHLPPPRLRCIETALHPDHVQTSGGCLDPECRWVACSLGPVGQWQCWARQHH